MSRRIFLCIAFIGFLTVWVAGQDAAPVKWTRFESGKELAFSLPPGYMVDTQEDDAGIHIMGFHEGVRIDFWMYNDENALERLMVPELNKPDTSTFQIGEISGVRTINRAGAARGIETLHLASESTYYSLRTEGPSHGKAVIERVFNSVRVDGRPLFAQAAPGKEEVAAGVVSLDKALSSPAVVEAYNRKYQKRDIKVTFELASSYKDDPEPMEGVRPPFVLQRPIVEIKIGRSAFNRFLSFEAKLKANFLANGEVGDITVYSNASREFGEACVDSLRRAKFIPAQAGGKNIDMVFTDECKAGPSLR